MKTSPISKLQKGDGFRIISNQQVTSILYGSSCTSRTKKELRGEQHGYVVKKNLRSTVIAIMQDDFYDLQVMRPDGTVDPFNFIVVQPVFELYTIHDDEKVIVELDPAYTENLKFHDTNPDYQYTYIIRSWEKKHAKKA
jgi:hypothetical protein